MVALNLFRPLAKDRPPSIDDDEESTYLDPQWWHLQSVYKVLLLLVRSLLCIPCPVQKDNNSYQQTDRIDVVRVLLPHTADEQRGFSSEKASVQRSVPGATRSVVR